MDDSSGSGNAGSSSWPSLATFQERLHLRGYAKSKMARLFQSMPISEDSRTVHDAPHAVILNTRVGTWIKRRECWRGCGAVLGLDNASRREIPFFHSTEERI